MTALDFEGPERLIHLPKRLINSRTSTCSLTSFSYLEVPVGIDTKVSPPVDNNVNRVTKHLWLVLGII